ncbi:MAG TPA: hypothetical protein VNF71_00900 [Acidimicrobiales bacterium]|nr:hypothetical protein [Acidimicrobiales bacterium]
MADIETTTGIEAEEEAAHWLAEPPPPPPASDGTAGGAGAGGAGSPAGRDSGLATRLPMAGATWQSAAAHLREESPWMLASAGVLVALAAYWVASVVAAFEHGHHLTAQERVLRIFAPGSFVWVLGAIVAVALFSAGRRFELPPARLGPLRAPLAMALVLAGSAAVASAAMSAVVELANFGHGILAALAALLGYLGTLVLAAAAAWWANREHQESAGAR